MRLHRCDRRGGATTVEFAVVAILLFMLLFGIFEYGRFLFIHHLASNAARDAVRYAVVHTGDVLVYSGSTVPVTEQHIKNVAQYGRVVKPSETLPISPNAHFAKGMCGLEGNIIGFKIDVYAIPDADLFASPPKIDAAGKPAWDTAGFNQKVAVQITGSYRPVVPQLLNMSSSIPFKVTALYGSEAN